ncbi:hypothetical protein IB270_07625 [Ensifer sp. ENS05]|uniref:hypothetical protein n=1 Tax=Ensifer sp. ENS05 TaxID=2769277 RepID=UPI001786B23B|nr:hypothetical protein [Ensifer sp. ENS05]MBD9592698.1 hypothetical protein [Ensifer sp. ENS05]
MDYPEEHEPTNRVLYLITRLNGDTLRVDGGKVGSEKELPAAGDGKFIDGIGCRIDVILKTPNSLEYTWTIQAVEH